MLMAPHACANILRIAEAFTHDKPLTDINICVSWLLCLVCMDKFFLTFAVLKQWHLQQRETEDSFVYTIKQTSCLRCFDAVGWASGRASGL